MPLLTAILRVNKVVSGGDSGAATSVLARKCCFILLLLARTGPNLRSKFREESIARATSYTLYTLLRAQTRGENQFGGRRLLLFFFPTIISSAV